MTEEPAVRVDSVFKTFEIPVEHVHTLKERALHPFRRSAMRELAALRGVNFNGSGKSTLLKCMAGIYAADRGRIYMRGRVSTFIELGVGFNVDLPARDNVLLNATMLGLSAREARRRFDEVMAFAELEEFVDLKLKNYSSGMLVRLAFAVMIQVDAEILLIDEVLAVGDANFQQKCYTEFARLRREGRTVVLVTHDLSAVQRFCDRAMLLERGELLEVGPTEHVANRYLEVNFGDRHVDVEGEARVSPAEAVPEDRFGDGKARVLEAWFEDEDGTRTDVLPTLQQCSHVMRVVFGEDALDPVFSIVVESGGAVVVMTADKGVLKPTGRFAAGETVVVRTRFQTLLAPDRYFCTPAVAHAGNVHYMDRPVRLQQFTVTGARFSAGLLELPFEVDVEREQVGQPSEEALP
jgi:ABC-type polysaccharide/polyol phosphate transport system ATPase subunit